MGEVNLATPKERHIRQNHKAPSIDPGTTETTLTDKGRDAGEGESSHQAQDVGGKARKSRERKPAGPSEVTETTQRKSRDKATVIT